MKNTTKTKATKTTVEEYEGQKENKEVFDLLTSIIAFEGGEEMTEEQYLELFSYLIKSGQCWSLQGMYGREASRLISSGVISRKGEIL